MTRTFATRCASAELQAWQRAQPYCPSRADHEAHLEPLVRDLCAMSPSEAQAYVRATYAHRSLMPLAVKLYKARVVQAEVTA
jgi:hypothetical protein